MADATHSAPPDRTIADVRPMAHGDAVARGRGLIALDAIADDAWRHLAGRALEPNGYYLPEWVRAVNGSPRRHKGTAALVACSPTNPEILTGLLPVLSAWRAWKLPIPALVSADPYRSLDTPLIDRQHQAQAITNLLDQARRSGAHALILRLLPLHGAAATSLVATLKTMGLRPRVLMSYRRACLDATGDAEILLREALGPKKLKELRRLRHRLAERGAVTFKVARDAESVAAAFDVFLTLEASGWKGRRGTAMAQQADDAPLMRQATIDLATRGQCEIVTLKAGNTPVAAGIVLRHQDRAFFFKLGIDESFARYSPGVQLTLDLTRHLCADPAIVIADSTASPNHPMIDPIWRGRLDIGDLLIPLARHDPWVPVIHAAILTREYARRMALKVIGVIRRNK